MSNKLQFVDASHKEHSCREDQQIEVCWTLVPPKNYSKYCYAVIGSVFFSEKNNKNKTSTTAAIAAGTIHTEVQL